VEIAELLKAQQSMKPILVFYCKSRDINDFGKKTRKDAEVEATVGLDENLWKRWIITELAKAFVCIRVDVRKADVSILRKHHVARAPVIEILDFRLKPIHFSPDARQRVNAVAKVMGQARSRVEKEVRKLAAGEEDSPLAVRARTRARVIEQRDLHDRGLTALEKRRWKEAEKQFQKALAIEQECAWKKKCEKGLLEIEAGKIFVNAEKRIKAKRYAEARDLLAKILADYKEATFFRSLAKEKLGYVESKMK
jgi:tetratricopeptide (TPR) repeat protein